MSSATFVDSHCHLDRLNLEAHGGDFSAMMAATEEAGVSHMLCIGVDLETFPDVQALAEQYPHVFASVGVHPLYKESREPSVTELLERAAHPKVIAIGETGLDYFYAKEERDWQKRYFIAHIQAARETGLPLVVHTRGAKDDTLSLLREHGGGEVKGVLHCFTEDLDMAQQAIELGFYISISGIVTFRNAESLRDVVRALPIEKLLIETDSPWLAPVPFRGKPNEPRFVANVAECVAELKDVSVEQLGKITADNFFTLFSKAQR
ncbi:TatD family deoxyribonuclease [Alcanivorax nanhaiticus]|uniref:TatD family deoxyribonuclease n=1 Tax=Alcanivorax nanhaiticus TaxID=1177154 RepID=A0A095SH89_9GAMM|nr:TatD family hydrolase [Alcanivorax nanhaiticus]KGD63917.1 TatD family deoxyribonuclease [Alcanivorax nanhaiticus]